MKIRITPSQLKGHITVPTSKSEAHRALICAGLAAPGSRISGITESADIAATRAAITGMKTSGIIPCGESGSTLRFLLPIAAAKGGCYLFQGSRRLLERPLEEYFGIFEQQRIHYEISQQEGTLTISGTLDPGRIVLRGDVSSQYVTGLLLALPMLPGDSEIVLTTPLQSASYVEITLAVMKAFGVRAERTENGFSVPGGQVYSPCAYTVEPDYSQAAFWLTANVLGSEIVLQRLPKKSRQGDRVIESILNQKPENLCIDAGDCPDLVPILAVYGCFCKGESRIFNAARLRLKESDRLQAITAELNALGAEILEEPDALVIHGVSQLQGGAADCHNDHRIAMALAVAATRCREPVILNGAECVAKSYVDFWKHYRKLGGRVDEC